ncbi:MAG: hypothetical protein NTW96_15705 [Planctomycetia bacterium]|nr:hypothetical protein [Planctomycetia bacterium]
MSEGLVQMNVDSLYLFMRTLQKQAYRVLVLAVLGGAALAAAPETTEPPPNAPGTVEWNAGEGRLSLRYHGGAILEATVGAEDASGRAAAGVEVKLEPTVTPGEKVEQRLKFVLVKPKTVVWKMAFGE